MAIVLITHDLGVVADLCTRAVVMYAGEVVENADAETLFAAPAHPYTKALLESNPIMGRPRSTLRSIPGTVPSPAMWPQGCHFYDRCPVHIAACASEPVRLEPLGSGPGHAARCIRADTRHVGDRVNGKVV
jgi:peptide/nickel transport system permease protein